MKDTPGGRDGMGDFVFGDSDSDLVVEGVDVSVRLVNNQAKQAGYPSLA